MVANAGIIKLGSLLDGALFASCSNLFKSTASLKLVREVSDEDFDKHYTVNVKGVLYSYRAAARVMVPAGYGRIVGACSVAGKCSMCLNSFG